MRRHQLFVVALLGTALATAAGAQSTPNTKESIIAAMTAPSAAPPAATEESDVIPLPGVHQKGFSLGLSGAGARPAPVVNAPRPAMVARSVRHVNPGRATNRAFGASPVPAYGQPLEMRVSFALNSATLTDEGNREARTFADAVNTPKLSAQHFIVAGHTDARGNPLLNRKLSQRRAQSVVDYLVSQGVDRSRLVAAGFGSDRPLPGTSARDAGNRRVEFARTN